MDGDKQIELHRLDAVNEAVLSLRDICHSEEPLEDALERAASAACTALPGADAVTISVLAEDGKARTLAYTDVGYLGIDAAQYAGGRGPCLDSARTQRPVRAVVGDDRERWPEFTAAAEDASLAAYLSVPLLVAAEGRELEMVGSLNLYSHDAEAFDPFDEALGRLFTTAAVQAISNARRWRHSRDQIRNLQVALDSRAEIDQAKGALMAVHGCEAEQAFAMLVEHSQHRNVKLRDIAREFLRKLSGHGPEQRKS